MLATAWIRQIPHLDVTVQDALAVQEGHCLQQLSEQGACLPVAQPPLEADTWISGCLVQGIAVQS